MSGNFRNEWSLPVVTFKGGGRRFRDGRGRHVSFMKPRKNNDKRKGGSGVYRDNEGDITMTDDGPSYSRYNPYSRKSRRHENRSRLAMDKEGVERTRARDRLGGGSGKYKNDDNFRIWKKIIIPQGKELGMEYILKNLEQFTNAPICPFYFHFDDSLAVFYVNDRDIINSIAKAHRRITTPMGFKMPVFLTSESPKVPLSEKVLEKIKVVMSKRYDLDTQALNIKEFHQDPDLISEGLYISLQRDDVFSNIIRIIEQNIPQLISLDLSGNRLSNLKHLGTLPAKAPNLKKLILSQNAISDAAELGKISDFKLEELVLDGNPVCDRYRNQSEYIRMVRQYFPRVIKLDSIELPPPILFDVETTTPLPAIQQSFFINEEAQAVIVKFLEQYFLVYDSDNRQSLLEAYHDQALFSLSLVKLRGASDLIHQQVEDSRNLLRVTDFDKRLKLLRKGRLNIVSYLCQLPKTKHDPNSIIVDITCASPALINFCIKGIYKEGNRSSSSSNSYRAFTRVFVAIPIGNSILITNEELFVANASAEQVQSAFKSAAPTPSSSPVPKGFPENVSSSSLTPEQKQMMVTSFAQQSGMNDEWSIKCLEENDWDYNKAAAVFMVLKNQSSIPMEAFLK